MLPTVLDWRQISKNSLEIAYSNTLERFYLNLTFVTKNIKMSLIPDAVVIVEVEKIENFMLISKM
jgi:hypothetical protein